VSDSQSLRRWFATAFSLARKDLLIEFRTGESIAAGAFLGALLAVLASMSFYTGPAGTVALLPGVLWLSVTFTSVLTIGKAYQRDREDGAFFVTVAMTSPSAVFVGKVVSNIVIMTVIEACVVAIAGVVLTAPLLGHLAILGLLLLLANIGVSVIGILFGAMTLHTRARELLLASVMFPLLSPLLLIGVSATRALFDGSPSSEVLDWIKLLGVFDLVFAVASAILFPVAAHE
jgi:heme exporter protein B